MSLLKFFFTEKCSNCHQRVEKAASFCRHCGAGRANSWRKCTACGVSVAADSQFCWSCNANLSAQPRDQIFSDRWRRTPGVFATRITIETPNEHLRNGVQVDDGVRGALFKDGSIKAELGNGYHTQTSFWDRLTGGKTGTFVEAVVAASDPVSSFVSLMDTAKLFTRDDAAVEAAVLVKVRLGDFATFVRRMMPTGTDVVRDDDLLLPQTARVAEIIRRHLAKMSVVEAARSTELRHEIEAALGRELPALLEEYGLVYGGVEDVRLNSPEIERVREAEGNIARTSRELGWEKVQRELQQTHKLAELKDEFAFKEQLDQWTHEYTLTSMDREHIVEMRRIQIAEARGLADAHAQGRVQNVQQDYELERQRKEALQDAEDLKMIRDEQLKTLRELQAMKLAKKEAEAEIAVRLATGTKDVRPENLAGVLGGEQGATIVRALEQLRPQPNVTVVASVAPFSRPVGVPSFMSQGYAPSAASAAVASNLEQLAQRYIGCVGVVVIGQPGITMMPIGTAWVVAGRNAVATNAHVAQEVMSARDDAGMSAWVVFSGSVTPLPVRSARIHFSYGHGAAQEHPVPSNDVALLDLEGALPVPGLPLASRQKAYALRELQPVAYLGFPMENLAGGGTNLDRPKAIAKRGSISSLEDWMMRHADSPAQRQLIKHDLGVAGGASGSPLFDEAGDVIGIISAGNMEKLYDDKTKSVRRIPSGVMLNFAQRIDVLLDWCGW